MISPADVTARIVASHMSIGQVSRRRMSPREQSPNAIEAEYATRLIAEVQQWRESLAPLMTELPSLIASARMDSDNESYWARRAIERGRLVVRRSAADVQTIAPRIGRRVADQQRTQLSRQLKAGLGVDVPTADRKVPAQIDRFTDRNVAKIRSLGHRTLDEIERLIDDAFTSKVPVDDLVVMISNRFKAAESSVRFFVGEQITKLNAQVRRARHAELGIVTFVWKTRADGLVRPSHEVKYNRIFPYTGSRAPSFFPGEERLCRCWAQPVLDDIRTKAGIPAGRGRQRIV